MEKIFYGCKFPSPPDILKWNLSEDTNIKDIFSSSSFNSEDLPDKSNDYKSSNSSSVTISENVIINETFNDNDILFNNNSESNNEYYENFYN